MSNNFKKDSLGNRMKENYESRTRYMLPKRTYTMFRLDGRAFHTYTKHLKRPFDLGLIDDMNSTAIYVCDNISNVKFAYVQSDEITVVMTDFDTHETEPWFDNNLQKICSVSASLATEAFNKARLIRRMSEYENKEEFVSDFLNPISSKRSIFKTVNFDSRVWTMPSRTEVINSFIWRQQDCVRNSIQSVAQSLYKHKELENKNTKMLQEMIFEKGINWNEYDATLKRGRGIVKQDGKWIATEVPTFSTDQEFLKNLIPIND